MSAFSRLIKVNDCNNARWKPETNTRIFVQLSAHAARYMTLITVLITQYDGHASTSEGPYPTSLLRDMQLLYNNNSTVVTPNNGAEW